MKVTAFIGSARHGHTYKAAETLLNHLKSLEELETEIVELHTYNIQICRGCKLCCDKGEELCPLKDDRDLLIEKIDSSDGVIFATPNYSFHISGMMKVFLDRLAFLFHRPRFFGKTCTALVTQGIFGAGPIQKYFSFVGNAFGFNFVKGCVLTTLEPIKDKTEKNNQNNLYKLGIRFYNQLKRNEFPSPSLFELLIFNLSRKGIKKDLNEEFRDYNYFNEKGWFDSDYYYKIKLNPLKKLVSRLLKRM